jgi:hypothetical protein
MRSKTTDGHNGVQPFGQMAEPMATELEKPTSADHSDTPYANGKRAQPAEDCIRSLVHIQSRVDLLLAAVPYETKAKMLSAWLSGAS